ncbi:WXG100 family type VII secretion target, partial [Nocardia cyriacigeorgica]
MDLAELENITTRLQGLIGFVEDCLTQIDTRVAAVQSSWSGQAADAHATAHRDWLAGAQDMRDGLERMRAAAVTARDNYTSA